MDIHVNDVMKMKKTHPCGSREWLVLRVGMDFKLRCQGCGREVMIPRSKAEKSMRQVLRDGQRLELTGVDLGMEELEDGTRIIRPGFYMASEPKTFGGGVKYTFLWMLSTVRQVWISVLNLLTGNFSLSELSGPVGVSAVIGQASALGLVPLLTLVGFVTVNIGVFNLLPLPALDGGRLLFLLIELVIRRPVNPKYEGLIHTAGFLVLMGLMLVVTFNDLVRLF